MQKDIMKVLRLWVLKMVLEQTLARGGMLTPHVAVTGNILDN